MDNQLIHDPRTKQQIKELLYTFLYSSVDKQFKSRIDSIITKNAVLLGASHRSFSYKGVFYSCDTVRPPRKMNRLVIQLHPAMDSYLQDIKKLNDTEIPYVIGFITQVLNSSNDLHDYLKILPVSVHQPIEELITSCPCRTKKLTDFDVDCIKKKYQSSIDMMKARMVINLLI